MKETSGEGQKHLKEAVSYLKTDNGQRMAICIFSIIATLVLVGSEGSALAYAFGIPYMFLVPGFAVVRLFFWSQTSPEAKFVLSLGLSVLVVIILGLILVLTPIGLDSDTTRASLILFTLGAVAVETFYPRKDKGARPEETPRPPSAPIKIDKVVAAMLGAAIVVSGVSMGLILTAEHSSRTYFAMTDEHGDVITNTSRQFNTTLTVLVHMKNGEDGPRVFSLFAYGPSVTGDRETQTFEKTLAAGELWVQTVVFDLDVLGFLRIDLDLYIQEEDDPPNFYGNLHLWFDVLT
ncbi:MAG: DUF1616 domain-containing protein [Candidatus Thermoplasmatota archaeon]|nr:DUF1616 domain-containing protein [Candidatus Thermoplasmatota archaeon]